MCPLPFCHQPAYFEITDTDAPSAVLFPPAQVEQVRGALVSAAPVEKVQAAAAQVVPTMEQLSEQVVGTMTDMAPQFTQGVKEAGQRLEEGAKQAATTIKVW